MAEILRAESCLRWRRFGDRRQLRQWARTHDIWGYANPRCFAFSTSHFGFGARLWWMSPAWSSQGLQDDWLYWWHALPGQLLVSTKNHRFRIILSLLSSSGPFQMQNADSGMSKKRSLPQDCVMWGDWNCSDKSIVWGVCSVWAWHIEWQHVQGKPFE